MAAKAPSPLSTPHPLLLPVLPEKESVLRLLFRQSILVCVSLLAGLGRHSYEPFSLSLPPLSCLILLRTAPNIFFEKLTEISRIVPKPNLLGHDVYLVIHS